MKNLTEVFNKCFNAGGKKSMYSNKNTIAILNYIVYELEKQFNVLNAGEEETTKENKEKQNEILDLIDDVRQTIKNK
tara:strand:+ start:135 stop:365 length:231 start_codon:yes stop_codon:yes gene_type:complete